MKKGLFLVMIVWLIVSCGDGNIIIQVDAKIQLTKDSIIIADYMKSKGYDDFKTTPTGVRYFVTKKGTGNPIDESDIVTFDYIGMLTNDSIFDTSVKTIGDSIRNVKDIPDKFTAVFTETRTYAPFTLTYSSSGWATSGVIQGFAYGIAATFKDMNIGGSAIIAMPSSLGYGVAGSGKLIPANSVLIFELLPKAVTKQ